jgi:hypothetical protein
MTNGGGAPGPFRQLNGEIYYPPYLFKKNGSGEFGRVEHIAEAAALAGDVLAADKVIDRAHLPHLSVSEMGLRRQRFLAAVRGHLIAIL